MLWKNFFMEADKGGAGGGAGGGEGGKGGGTGDGSGGKGGDGGKGGGKQALQYESWLAAQPDEVKTLLENNTKGLKSALSSERDARAQLEKDLRDAAKKAEKGSEMETQLTQMADQVAESDRKTDFYEAAHQAGITNLKLAYTVAVQDEMFDKRGLVNFEEMKKSYPELFGTNKKPDGNAGAGTGGDGTPTGNMNDWIRQAAGRK